MTNPVAYLKGKKEELSRHYGITQIGVFGSRIRGDNRNDSDLDVLVELEKPYRIDFLKFIELQQTLSDEIGLKVDLVLKEDLKPSIGESVLREVVYL